MLVLGVETSTMHGGVALVGAEGLISEHTLNVRATHTERLLPAIDRMLHDAGLGLNALSGLAVSTGPGSFTGLRIGLSTVKGLAYATDLPVVGVPSLEALAWTLPYTAWQVCPVLDARKGEVYLSLYRWKGGRMERQWDYAALSPRSAGERLEPPVIMLGDGVSACLPFLSHLGSGLRVAPPSHAAPSAAVVGLLGHAMLASGDTVAAESVEPLYLRPSEAELKARRS